jgi:hypothetical protein
MELHRAVDKVGIIVRNVYDGGAALEFNLPLSDTLRALKLQIQSHLQEKPHPHEQKLIFCGKVWDDGVRLGEILSKVRPRSLAHARMYICIVCWIYACVHLRASTFHRVNRWIYHRQKHSTSCSADNKRENARAALQFVKRCTFTARAYTHLQRV